MRVVIASWPSVSWFILLFWVIQIRGVIPPRLGLRCGIDSRPGLMFDSTWTIVALLTISAFFVFADALEYTKDRDRKNLAASTCVMGLLLWFDWHIVYCGTFMGAAPLYYWAAPFVAFPLLGLAVDHIAPSRGSVSGNTRPMP